MASQTGDNISVIDASTNTIVNTIAVGVDPTAIGNMMRLVNTPALGVSKYTLSGFRATIGSNSVSQNFKVRGANLTANATLSLSTTDYELSTDNTTFSPTLNFVQSGGTLTGQPITVYVRLKAGLTAGVKNANLTIASTGATNVVIALTGQAISPANVWAKNPTGTGFDRGRAIALDVSGSLYITGTYSGTVDFDAGAGTANLTALGGLDIFFAKYDNNGDYVWAKSVGSSGANSDEGLSITTDAAGNVYIAGSFTSTVDFDLGTGTTNLVSNGLKDIFVAKYDNGGNFIWAKSIGGTLDDEALCLKVDASGNVYLTGYFADTNVDFNPNAGTALLSSAGVTDIFLVKLDASGNYLWANKIGNTNTDEAKSLALDASGNIYLTGFFRGTVDFDPSGATNNLISINADIFFAKYDTNGNYVWAKGMGNNTALEAGNGIALDASGNVYVTGGFAMTTDFDPNAGTANLSTGGNNVAECFIAKYDNNGNYAWAKSIGDAGTTVDAGYDIAVDVEGSVYVTGIYNSAMADFDGGTGIVNLPYNTNADAFYVKYSTNGDYQWAKAISGNNIDQSFAIAVDAFKNIYVMGGFYSTGTDFDPDATTITLSSAGSSDVFFLKYAQPPTATAATNVTKTSFTANWTNQSATSYRLDVSISPTFGSFVAGYNDLNVGSVTSYNVTGLTANMVYYYRVRAFNVTATGNSNTKMTSTILPPSSANTVTFDATAGKKIEVADNTVFNFTSTHTFTIEAWIKINALGSQMDIISKTDGITGYALFITATGNIGIARDATGSIIGTTTLPTGKWIHLSVAFNAGGGYTAYINGISEAVNGASTITSNTHKFNIASRSDDTFPFNGQVEEVRIWNTTRTITELQTNMCRKLIGTETGLVGYFRFDEGTGTITENKAAGSSVDGTLINAPIWATSTAPIGDVSAFTYGGSTLTLTDLDAFAIGNFTGAPTGMHIYKVKEAPTVTTSPVNYQSLYTDRYWGVFAIGGTTPKFDVTYNYQFNPFVSSANALRLASRDNALDSWSKSGGIINRTDRKLSKVQHDAGEFILANRNAVHPAFRNGGVCLKFDGLTRHGRLANFAQDDFTLEFWIRTNQTSVAGSDWKQGNRCVDASSSIGVANDFGTSILNGKLAFGVGGTSNTTIQSLTTLNDGEWHHVGVTRVKSTGAMQIVIDGELETTGTGSTATLGASAFLRLASELGTGKFLDGEIDELRVWGTALTPATLKDWMNLRANNQHPNFSNLITYYRFDENIGALSEDLVNGNDGDLFNGVVWANANMPLGDGAYQRMVVNAGGVYDFANANLKLTFPATGTYPNGELVATRLDVFPDALPFSGTASYTSAYWVIRNYGTNQTFTNLEEIEFNLTSNNTYSPLDVISTADLATPSNIKMFKRPDNAVGATTWALQGVATSITSGPRVKVGGGTTINSFSQFILGSNGSLLPINLISFTGERVSEQENVLRWITASEQNNKGFEVERSQDGQTFEKIGYKEGVGNSSLPTEYVFLDASAFESYYYRLKQIDVSGKITYSPLIFVKAQEDKLWVYPNPATDRLQILLHVADSQTLKTVVYNAQGNVVWQYDGTLKHTQSELNESFQDWQNGLYVLRVQYAQKILTTKFIKQR